MNEGFNEGPASFQEKVTGVHRQWGYVVPYDKRPSGVMKFDGWSDDTLIDAKARHSFFGPNGEIPEWYGKKPQDALRQQAEDQIAAAGDHKVQWIVEDQATFNAFQKILEKDLAKQVNLTLYDPDKHNKLKVEE